MPAWTPSQHDAIYARGGTLLVSAAAGSGKTAVLAERVISLLCDKENPASADKLLICTFSRAAAAEMKQRISARLSALIQENPQNAYLQRQQALLASAQISTVHSFCAELIRQNFQHIDITPDFQIMDEAELSLLMDNCLNELLEEYYKAASPEFLELVGLFSNGRNDRRLYAAVFKLYSFARSHPFYERWLDEKLALYDENISVENSPWGQYLLKYAKTTLEYCLQSMQGAIAQMQDDERFEKAYIPVFRSDIFQITTVSDAINNNNWNAAVIALRAFKAERLGIIRGDDTVKAFAQATRARCKDLVQELREVYLNATADEYCSDIEYLRPKLFTLFVIVRRFSELVWNEKKIIKKLDYSDLEHLTLSLLVEPDGAGYARKQDAKEISQRYQHILVDEYQDTNEVQETIFASISRDGSNLFMVGDIKQSIYSFRQAMPEIFLRKKQTFFSYNRNGSAWPATVSLDKNFRSRNTVTNAVNYLFALLMSSELGGLDYDDAESLKCGASYPDYEAAAPEFLLLDTNKNDSGEDAVLLEARMVAHKIRDMLENRYMVSDDNSLRPCEPRDFCIIMRSPKIRAPLYVKELTRIGVAATAANASGFLDTREIAGVISMLRALANPLLDVPLTAAMLSPMFDFTVDDLAEIRLAQRRGSFYLATVKTAQSGSEKAAHFIEIFTTLRTLAATSSTQELIKRLYSLTDLLEVVGAMPLGKNRQANLLQLVTYAANFHNAGYKGLIRFVALIDKLAEKGEDLEPATTSDTANTVQIMSVHRSKGLEFPIVFLSDTARRINMNDLRDSTLLHSELGFACQRRDELNMRQHVTLPMGAIRLAGQQTQLAEEMRIMYVALTRAREKLIITANINGATLEKRLSSLAYPLTNNKLPSHPIRTVNCWRDWLIMALLHHPSANDLRDAADIDKIDIIADNIVWQIGLISPINAQEDNSLNKILHTATADPEIITAIGYRINFTYPNTALTITPTKLAVSDVAKGKKLAEHRFARRPQFVSNFDGLNAAERGNAMHKFMQFSNYTAARDNLSNEIMRMQAQNFLSVAEVNSLSRQRLRNFFTSALAKRMFHSNKVLRELRFMAEFGKERLVDILPQMNEHGKVVLQGVADCVFIEPDGAVIIDYKTDHVNNMDELLSRYSMQLLLYKEILGESLDCTVKECVLYSFALSDWVLVK